MPPQNPTVKLQIEATGASSTVGQIKQVQKALDETQKSQQNLFESLGDVAFRFNNLVQSVQLLAQQGKQAYDLLIGQNEQLQQQVLSTQASLAATSDVFLNGIKVGDPSAAIDALQKPIDEALANIRKASVDLVGVTGADLVPLFQVIASNAGAIANQSARIPDPIKAAEELTVKFAATMGTLQIPLAQGRQEITSILQGTIDVNSAIAKSLGLTNDTVARWKAQGIAVDKLNELLQPFLSANQKAARSVTGIASNLRDVLETVTQIAGKPLFEGVVDKLEEVYEFVKSRQAAIQQGLIDVVTFVQDLLKAVGTAIDAIAKELGPVILELGEVLFNDLGDGAEKTRSLVVKLSEAAVGLAKILRPVLEVGVDLLRLVINFARSPVGQIAITTAAIVAGIGPLTAALAGLVPVVTGVVTALPALAASFGTMLIAINPLLVAAVALAAALVKIHELQAQNEASEAFAKSAASASDETFNLTKRLKELQAAAGKDGVISPEEAKKLELTSALIKDRVKDNDALIASMKAAIATNPELANSLGVVIQELENKSAAALAATEADKKATEGAKIQTKALTEQGTVLEQLAQKAAAAKRTLGSPADITAATEAAKTLVDTTQKQLELGSITAKDAIANLKLIARDSRLNETERLAAQKELSNLVKEEGERRVAAIASQEENIKQLVAQGVLSQVSGEKKISENKVKEIKARIDAKKQEVLVEEEFLKSQGKKGLVSDRLQKLLQEQKRINTELRQEEEKQREAANKAELEDFDEQIAILEANFSERLISEGEYIRQKGQLQLQQANTEIKQVREKLSKLSKTDKEGQEALLKQEAEARKKRAEVIRKNQDDLVRLQQERLRKEIDVTVKTIEEGNKKLRNATNQLSLRSDILSFQQKIAQSQFDLEKARSDLQATTDNIRVQKYERALEIVRELNDESIKGTEVERQLQRELNSLGVAGGQDELAIVQNKQALENAIADRKRAALERELQQQQRLLEIEIQRNKLAADRELLQARAAVNEARQVAIQQQSAAIEAERNLSKAQRNLSKAKTPEAKEDAQKDVDIAQRELNNARSGLLNAQEGIDLAKESLKFAEDRVTQEKTFAEESRKTLEIQQASALAEASAAESARQRANELERARAATQSLGGTSATQGRFRGGAMEAGTPYWVGEGAGGRILPTSEIVVPGVNSYAIASQKAQEWLKAGQLLGEPLASAQAIGGGALLGEIKGLRADIKGLETGNKDIKFYNTFSRGDEKLFLDRVRRQTLSVIDKVFPG